MTQQHVWWEIVKLWDILLTEDEGVSEAAYNQMYGMASGHEDLREILAVHVDAVDGRFFLKDGICIEGILRQGG